MALKEIVQEITDDITGAAGATTYKFTFHGIRYEIDLAGDNAAAFEKVEAQLEKWADAGRLDTGGRGARGREAPASTTTVAVHRRRRTPQPAAAPDPADKNAVIREWWRQNQGLVADVTGRAFAGFGPIPPDVRAAFAETQEEDQDAGADQSG